jgi:hypothetical protein
MDCDEKRLLKRMVPAGFLAYLKMPILSPMEEDQLDELEQDAAEENIKDAAARGAVLYGDALTANAAIAQAGVGTNTARLRKRIAVASATTKQTNPENFRIFFHVLTQGRQAIPCVVCSCVICQFYQTHIFSSFGTQR